MAKSAALMIDSERTEHPALSGHFARSRAAFSAVNVCDPTILSNSHTVLLALEGVGGLGGWGHRQLSIKNHWHAEVNGR